jgi:magnesium-transporting ATPase (P-type)
LEGAAVCEVPNDQIYKFEGSVTLNKYLRKISVSAENLLLRGSSLRNTEWVIGFVVYAGHQTKIMMNSANSRFKMSSIEKGTNQQIIFIFIA